MDNQGIFEISFEIESNQMMKCCDKLRKLIYLEIRLKANPWNQKSYNLEQDSQRN